MIMISSFQQLLFLLILLYHSIPSEAYNNGYGKKPFLGWQSWCSVGKCGTDHCFDRQIRSTAKAMVDNGMKALGFEWVVLDDCWHPSRNDNGTLVPYAEFFPNGIKPVVDYVHSLGLKFGLYTSVGTRTCHGGWSPGSYGYYQQDADLFASWEVDYVKVDWCGDKKTTDGHMNISKALNRTGRHIVLELCRGNYQKEDHWGYAPEIAQVWRSSGDHHDNFQSTLGELASIKGKSDWSGPYGWAYMDMMMVGGEGCKDYDPDRPEHCPKQTDDEYRTECALYSVCASPMMIGTDIRNMTKVMKDCLLNPKILAINQDYLAKPGAQTKSCGDDAWVRKLSDGTFAVVVPNLSNETKTVNVCFDDIGMPNASALVYDVWSQTNIGNFTYQWGKSIQSHDNVYVILKPSSPPPVGCHVTCTDQISHTNCIKDETYGCSNETKSMWVSGGCRGTFTCDRMSNIDCESKDRKNITCPCSGLPAANI